MNRSLTLFVKLVIVGVVVVTLLHLIGDPTNYEKKRAYHLDHHVCLADLNGQLLDYTLFVESPLFPVKLLSRGNILPFPFLKPPQLPLV